MNNRFLFACGSFLFSLIPAAVITLLPIPIILQLWLAAFAIVIITIVGAILPQVGKRLTLIFIGWSVSSQVEMAPGESELLNKITQPDFEDRSYVLKPKTAAIIILVAFLVFVTIWKFPGII